MWLCSFSYCWDGSFEGDECLGFSGCCGCLLIYLERSVSSLVLLHIVVPFFLSSKTLLHSISASLLDTNCLWCSSLTFRLLHILHMSFCTYLGNTGAFCKSKWCEAFSLFSCLLSDFIKRTVTVLKIHDSVWLKGQDSILNILFSSDSNAIVGN